MVIGFFSEYIDRWILQKYGGSLQQGFYAFAFNLSNMSLLAVSSMFLLFTRELSVSVGKNDIDGVAKLFNTYVPILYVIVSFFSCFLFFQADNVIYIFAGKDYIGASLSLRILSMYPLVCTFSMMSGSVIYATDRTYVFRNLSFVFGPLGVLISVLLMSPIAGINLGAAGLGIKNVSVEFFGVVIILFLNSRYLPISFRKYFLHLICTPIICLACAGASSYFLTLGIFKHLGVLFCIVMAGTIYLFMFITLVYVYPNIVFQERYEIMDVVNAVRGKFESRGGGE
jgi:O-antigen/teichoic acid export membrane protein